MNRIRAFAMVVAALMLVSTVNGQSQQQSASLTDTDIVAAIGSEADTRAALRVVLAPVLGKGQYMPFLLASQVRPEWVPPGSGAVLLSETDAATLLEQCGTYWVVQQVQRKAEVVSMRLRQRCGGTVLGYDMLFDGSEWRVTGQGIGSGFVGGPPPECKCLK